MALAINSSHPLASFVEALVGVDESNQVVDFSSTQTLTVNAGVTLGSGTYGKHFQTAISSGNSLGVLASPGWRLYPGASTQKTVFVVLNNIPSRSGDGYMISRVTGSVSPCVSSTGKLRVWHNTTIPNAVESSATVLDVGALSCAVSYNASTNDLYVYVNGVESGYANNTLGGGPITTYSTNIGGSLSGGYGSVSGQYVWFVVFDKELTDAEVLDLHNSLGSNNAFNLVTGSAPDLTAPMLTDPVITSFGSTTASGSVSTDEAGGTLYWLTSANASESVATVKAGSSQAVTAVGVQPVTVTGLTAESPYYLHFVHRDAAGNDSDVATSEQFTTDAPSGDTDPPTLTGVVTFTSITQTSYTANWPAGLDNVAVIGYEYQVGSTAGAWTDVGNNLSAAITGRTAGATETVYVRAYDAAGLRSTPPISGSVTLESALAAGINVPEPLKNNTDTVLANLSGVGVAILSASDFTYGLTTNGSGILSTISGAGITAGQQYHVAIKLADGGVGITGLITAS